MKEEKAMTATPVEPIVSPFYDRDGITIYNADARDILPLLPMFDLLLTDPPYGLGDAWKRTWHGNNGATKHWGDVPEWDKTTEQWMFDVVGKATDAIVWGAINYTTPPAASWLVWDKVQETKRSEFELAWSTLKSGNKMFRMSRIDAYVNCADDGKQHPNQKPVQLFEWCLSLFRDAKTVVDPFMGSGTTLVAAKRAGLRAVGIDIDRRWCKVAVSRLRQGVLDFGSEG